MCFCMFLQLTYSVNAMPVLDSCPSCMRHSHLKATGLRQDVDRIYTLLKAGGEVIQNHTNEQSMQVACSLDSRPVWVA